MSSDEHCQGENLADEKMTATITTDLLRRQQNGERISVELGPWSAWMLVTSAQTMVARLMRPGDRLAGALREATADIEQALEGSAAGADLDARWRDLQTKGYRC